MLITGSYVSQMLGFQQQQQKLAGQYDRFLMHSDSLPLIK